MDDITNLILVASVGMLILVIFIILFVLYYQKKMIQQQLAIQKIQNDTQKEILAAAIQTQEKERKRFAEDLHDEMGPLLSTIKMNVNQLRKAILDKDDLVDLVDDTKQIIDFMIRDIRSISKNLSPATLTEFGIVDALQELCNKVNASKVVEISFEYEQHIRRFPPKDELALYRIVQELINNILRHAEATKIDLSLTVKANKLYLAIKDNGKGFDWEKLQERKAEQRGLGIRNVESRVSMLNAEIKYDTKIGDGTRVMINFEMSKL